MPKMQQVSCRRCGCEYEYAGRVLLASCPSCGTSPVPLRKRLRHNGLAAALALVAMVVLVAGMTLPLISMTKLGTSRVFSLIGGILELYGGGDWLIGTVLLVFSVIFPVVKLLLILAATSALVPLSAQGRRRMHTFAVVTGKYSLLDILVVAVTIVLVRFGEFAQVRALPGTVLFCVAVLVSIAAGLCVNFQDRTDGG